MKGHNKVGGGSMWGHNKVSNGVSLTIDWSIAIITITAEAFLTDALITECVGVKHAFSILSTDISLITCHNCKT